MKPLLRLLESRCEGGMRIPFDVSEFRDPVFGSGESTEAQGHVCLQPTRTLQTWGGERQRLVTNPWEHYPSNHIASILPSLGKTGSTDPHPPPEGRGEDTESLRQLLGVPLTPDFVAVGLAYFAQARGGS